MECKVCGKECTGNTCSGACRAKLSRQAHAHSNNEAHAHAVIKQAHAEPTSGIIDRTRRKPGDEGYYGAMVEIDGRWIPRAKAEFAPAGRA